MKASRLPADRALQDLSLLKIQIYNVKIGLQMNGL